MENLIKTELIGKKFINKHNKRKDIETIIDIQVTTSILTGEISKVEYITEHDFLGQKIL